MNQMTDTQLATYLVGPSLPHLEGQVGRWLSTNRGFRSFADTYKDRIRKKLRDAGGPEDRRDIFAEVEFAYFITADLRFKVAYESYGSSDGRTPDFHVQTDHAGEFNFETKRVRESGATNDLEAVRQAIVDGIRSVPSRLGFCIDILHDDSPLELISRLRGATTAVVAQCVEAIRKSKDTLAPDQDVSLPIAGFEAEVRLTLTNLPGKDTNSPTAYLGEVLPVAYSQRESFKFSDVLFACLGQLRPGMANVLGVRITSSTHDPSDLPSALLEIGKLVQARDDGFFRKKAFDSAADFAGKIKALSAVVVKTDWHSIHGEQSRNYVWLNSVATVLLSADVADHLRSM